MSRRNTVARTRRHIWIDDDDWEALETYYGDSLGQSAVIRAMIKAMLAKIRSQAEQKGKPLKAIMLEELGEIDSEPDSNSNSNSESLGGS